MIPLKLELKNFLSYGSDIQTVDFKENSLICLSGKNGNGKSALLDAMTWAVWGQARKISGTIKPDSGLLRLGQTQMMVSFEFEFEKNIYRVRREFAKTYGKPYLSLDLDLFDQKDEKFISLTDKTIRLTQEKIEKLLGLDYETYINSAFLRQGQANEFSIKSPKERKQILSNILGFSRYDELQQLALDKSKTYQDEKKLILKLQEQICRELEKKEDVKSELKNQQESLAQINKESEKLQKDLLFVEKEKDAFSKLKNEYNFFTKEQKKLQTKLDSDLSVFKKNVADWKRVHYKTLLLPDFEKLEKEKEELINQEKKNLSLQQKSLTLQESILKTQAEYQKIFNILKSQKEKDIYKLRLLAEKKELECSQKQDLLKQKEQAQKDLDNKINLGTKQLEQFKNDLKKYEKLKNDLEGIQTQFEKRRAFYQVLIQKGNWIKTQLDELKQKDCRIQKQGSPSCPLCEQVLTIKRKQFLGMKFKKEARFLNSRLARISVLIKKLKEILLHQHNELKKVSKQEDFFKELIIKEQELLKSCKQDGNEKLIINNEVEKLKLQNEELLRELDLYKKNLEKQEKGLDAEIKEDVQVKEITLKLQELEKEKNDLKYDKSLHLELQAKIKNIEENSKELSLIKQGLDEQKNRKSKIKTLVLELKELKKTILEIEQKIENLKSDSNSEKDLEEKFIGVKALIRNKSEQKDKVLHQVGSFENELKRIEKLKSENKEKQEKLTILEEEIQNYQILAQSFGKNGIQALLIEQAIPEIEQEANDILAKLTDNQAQIFIESLRDLKGGGVKETLDIQISDSVGIRPYEMFSGGEAFRVDFALRIAISKLLARRAGTALQTLIIDEGFGSQDEEGLMRVRDAIYAIQKDFSKIIVVSHLVDFKDNFPSHFIVEKNSSGSFIRVEQRG